MSTEWSRRPDFSEQRKPLCQVPTTISADFSGVTAHECGLSPLSTAQAPTQGKSMQDKGKKSVSPEALHNKQYFMEMERYNMGSSGDELNSADWSWNISPEEMKNRKVRGLAKKLGASDADSLREILDQGKEGAAYQDMGQLTTMEKLFQTVGKNRHAAKMKGMEKGPEKEQYQLLHENLQEEMKRFRASEKPSVDIDGKLNPKVMRQAGAKRNYMANGYVGDGAILVRPKFMTPALLKHWTKMATKY